MVGTSRLHVSIARIKTEIADGIESFDIPTTLGIVIEDLRGTWFKNDTVDRHTRGSSH